MQNITCILCPMGCGLDVKSENGNVTNVTGNGCNRGKQYANEECTAPKRMLTALVRVKDREEILSVKTARPVPKSQVQACAKILRGMSLFAPINIGDVVLKDILHTGVDIIATKSVI